MPRTRAAQDVVPAALQAIDRFYRKTDACLQGREYLAGTFTYADIAFFMAQFFATFLGAPAPARLANLAAWRGRVGSRDSVRKVAGIMASYLRDYGVPLPPL